MSAIKENVDEANIKYRRTSNIGLWRYQHFESLKENKKINAQYFIANIGNAAMSMAVNYNI